MTKTVRFMIVLIVILVTIVFSWLNDSRNAAVGKYLSMPRVKSTSVADLSVFIPQEKLVLLEFFSGL